MTPETHWPPRMFPVGRDLVGQFLPNTAGPSVIESRAVLDAIVANVPESGIFAEIGTWCGSTAAYIADQRPNCLIVSVDPFLSDAHKMLWICNASIRPNMRLWLGNSRSFFRVAGPNTLAGIFIDGDHTEAGCYADLEQAARVVKLGGRILVHDYHLDQLPGVALAVDRFCAATQWRIAKTVGGLAVLEWRADR